MTNTDIDYEPVVFALEIIPNKKYDLKPFIDLSVNFCLSRDIALILIMHAYK